MMNSVKLSVIYYSATGTIHAMAERLTLAGEKAGAEVRLRQVSELAPPEAIASNAAWSQHVERTRDEPRAGAEDVVWADAVLFGTPTRYGNVASQLKQFLDTLGPQWAQGLLADKVYAGFTAAMRARPVKPSLTRMFSTWLSTVRWESTRRAAICLLVRPSAISPATSLSRRVSRGWSSSCRVAGRGPPSA